MLVASSVSEVSYALVARESIERIEAHVHGWLRKARVLALVLLLIGVALAPVVALIVGEGYPDIGWVVLLLTGPSIVQMVATSFSNILLALHLEGVRTAWNVARLVGLVAVYAVVDLGDLSYVQGVATFAAYTSGAYVVLLFLTLRGLRWRMERA